MGIAAPQRAAYRMRQFARAVQSYFFRPKREQWALVQSVLPGPALELYRQMPRPDQQHALRVLSTLRSRGFHDSELLQAALLHDIAKHRGGVTLMHRVAAVVIKAFRPVLWQEWAAADTPPSSWLWRPLWAHAHHAELGARLAAEAGCGSRAVALIAFHQDGVAADQREADLLAALRAADDDN
jgi:hypothetical protein